MKATITALVLRGGGLGIFALATCGGAELTIGASYNGDYRPDTNAGPYGASIWQRPGNALVAVPNRDNGAPSPGAASFRDDKTGARFVIHYPCGKAFGTDPAAMDYEYVFRAKFYSEGSGMPPRLIDRAVAGIGFHDEAGVSSKGKLVTLGFFLSDRLSEQGRQRVVGFIGEDGQLRRLVCAMDWLDGQTHEYRVKKYHVAGVARLAVRIDGAVVDDSAIYSDLPDATGDELGFWYSTSTPGTINATIESISFGRPAPKFTVGPENDPRDIRNGDVMYGHGYADQPYVVVNPDKSLTCILTAGGGTEGAAGQHVVSIRSRDGGKTWSEPVSLEPPNAPENSWGLPIIAKSGRIYALYTFNGENLRSVLDNEGKSFYRVDAVGSFVFRYSDDQGATWSAKRYTIPIRATDYDLNNIYRGDVNGDGKVDDKDSRFFWSPAAAFSDGSSVYVGIAKIRDVNPTNSGASEGWVFCSPNILTESDPEKIVWEMRPEGTHGLRSRNGRICEETTVIKTPSGLLAAICRTTDGVMPVFYSRNDGKSWTAPEPLAYALNGAALKNPRAKPCLWVLGDGKYLVWFENNGNKGFDNRNPAWVAVAEEREGRLVCSQPEIFLYDRDPAIRMSYPDLYSVDGRYFVTETQKTVARVHEIPAVFLSNLINQSSARIVVRDGLKAEWLPTASRNLRLPVVPDVTTQGMTLEFWVKFDDLTREHVLIDSFGEGKRGFRVATTQTKAAELTLSDGQITIQAQADVGSLKPGAWNHVVCIVDPGPRVVMWVINGRLSDGGKERVSGWTHYSTELKDIARTPAVFVSPKLRGTIRLMRYYDRALSVSEAISNFQHGSTK